MLIMKNKTIIRSPFINMINPNYKFIRSFTIASFIITMLLNSCTKNQNIVPYVYVDQYINISLPSYSSLNSDLEIIKNKKISISPLLLNLTDQDFLSTN